MSFARRTDLQQWMIPALERHPNMNRFTRLTGVPIAAVFTAGSVTAGTACGRDSGRIAKIDRTIAAAAARETIQAVDPFESWLPRKVSDERHVVANRNTQIGSYVRVPNDRNHNVRRCSFANSRIRRQGHHTFLIHRDRGRGKGKAVDRDPRTTKQAAATRSR
jgi:hypothetical protein